MTILWTVMLAALGATFMAINFHLANNGNHPWLIPADGFDETIDVDTVLALIQMAFFTLSGYLLLKLRRQHRPPPAAPTATQRFPNPPDSPARSDTRGPPRSSAAGDLPMLLQPDFDDPIGYPERQTYGPCAASEFHRGRSVMRGGA